MMMAGAAVTCQMVGSKGNTLGYFKCASNKGVTPAGGVAQDDKIRLELQSLHMWPGGLV